jgi:hypothetical protein
MKLLQHMALAGRMLFLFLDGARVVEETPAGSAGGGR